VSEDHDRRGLPRVGRGRANIWPGGATGGNGAAPLRRAGMRQRGGGRGIEEGPAFRAVFRIPESRTDRMEWRRAAAPRGDELKIRSSARVKIERAFLSPRLLGATKAKDRRDGAEERKTEWLDPA
jgi:hypothetical protein